MALWDSPNPAACKQVWWVLETSQEDCEDVVIPIIDWANEHIHDIVNEAPIVKLTRAIERRL